MSSNRRAICAGLLLASTQTAALKELKASFDALEKRVGQLESGKKDGR